MELLTRDFWYDLPEELIAQTPAEPRDSSRLMVYSRAEDKVTHAHFYDLPDFLKSGDLLVINNTKVIPARIFAHMEQGFFSRRISKMMCWISLPRMV